MAAQVLFVRALGLLNPNQVIDYSSDQGIKLYKFATRPLYEDGNNWNLHWLPFFCWLLVRTTTRADVVIAQKVVQKVMNKWNLSRKGCDCIINLMGLSDSSELRSNRVLIGTQRPVRFVESFAGSVISSWKGHSSVLGQWIQIRLSSCLMQWITRLRSTPESRLSTITHGICLAKEYNKNMFR